MDYVSAIKTRRFFVVFVLSSRFIVVHLHNNNNNNSIIIRQTVAIRNNTIRTIWYLPNIHEMHRWRAVESKRVLRKCPPANRPPNGCYNIIIIVLATAIKHRRTRYVVLVTLLSKNHRKQTEKKNRKNPQRMYLIIFLFFRGRGIRLGSVYNIIYTSLSMWARIVKCFSSFLTVVKVFCGHKKKRKIKKN